MYVPTLLRRSGHKGQITMTVIQTSIFCVCLEGNELRFSFVSKSHMALILESVYCFVTRLKWRNLGNYGRM